jgi:hypothetical protein
MSLIIYPDENYNSWISGVDAYNYFENRLYAEAWDTANREAALITAFNSINELDLTIDPTESDELEALKYAQCEQALYELNNDLDSTGVANVSLGGLLSVKIPERKIPPPRFSKRALSILRSYISAPSVKRTR